MSFIKNIGVGIKAQIDKLGLENKVLYYLGLILTIYGGVKVLVDIILSLLVYLGISVFSNLGFLGSLFNVYLGVKFIPGIIVSSIAMIIILGAGISGIKYWNNFSKYKTLEFWAKGLAYLFLLYTVINVFNLLGGEFSIIWYLLKLIVIVLYTYFAYSQRDIHEVKNR